jgi:hypothetical protein
MNKEENLTAEVDLDTNTTTILDSQGKKVDEKKFNEKVKDFVKKAVKYSPIGLSYTMSKSIMDRSLDMLDRAINENELNKVEEIKFTDIIALIKDGKDKFKELDLTFNASKVNGFNISKVKEALGEKDMSVDLGKKGDLQLKIKVIYK